MIKLILVLLLAFGAFMALVMFLPTSTHTAITLGEHAIPWFAIGVGAIAFLGWRAIK